MTEIKKLIACYRSYQNTRTPIISGSCIGRPKYEVKTKIIVKTVGYGEMPQEQWIKLLTAEADRLGERNILKALEQHFLNRKDYISGRCKEEAWIDALELYAYGFWRDPKWRKEYLLVSLEDTVF